MSIDMYLPGFPAIALDLATSMANVQHTLAAYFIGLALGQALYGPLADRFGRKPPLYAGLGLYVAASLGCALARDIDSLILLRFVQALGGCAGSVITRAMVRDLFDTQTAARIYATLMLVMGAAPILAPLAGGQLLVWFGWRAIFWALTGFGLLCLLAVHFSLPETRKPDTNVSLHAGVILRTYGSLLADRHFMGYVLSGGFGFAGMFAYITGSPFVFIELHGVPAQSFGWLFGLNALGLIAGSQLCSHLLRRWPAESILRSAVYAHALFVVAMLVCAITRIGGLPALLIPLFGAITALGFIAPTSAAIALSGHGQRAGSASALMGSLQFGIATLSSAAVGWLHDGTALAMAATMMGCALLSLLAHTLFIRIAPGHPTNKP